MPATGDYGEINSQPLPIRRHSRLWSQRGTKVNGSLHGGTPLLKPKKIRNGDKIFVRPTALGPQKYKMKHKSVLISVANIFYFFFVSPAIGWANNRKNNKNETEVRVRLAVQVSSPPV